MSRAAANTARYEERMKAKGFVRKHVWVPADKAGEVEALAEDLRRDALWTRGDASEARSNIIDVLTAHKELLKKALDIRHITLFGSFARGDAGSDSDVDLYVEREDYATTGLLTVVKIRDALSELLGREVDVVLDDIKNSDLLEAVNRDGVQVF